MSALRILQIAHDHPQWTPGGSEIIARDLARALDARPGVRARLLVAATSLQRPDLAPGALGTLGDDFVIRTGAYDRFTMTRLDGTGWLDSLTRVLDAVDPDIIHLHGVDRLGAEILPALRRLAPDSRIVLTLHDYQLICPNDGLLLTTGGDRCQGASPDSCRRCFPDQGAARHALRRAQLKAQLAVVDALVAPSRFLGERFLDWGIAAERIRLIPNAVAVSAPEAAPPGVTRPRADRFAFFGNIAPHKGVLTLLGAAARLRSSGDELRVALHGGLGWTEAGFRSAFAAALEAAHPVAAHLGSYHRSEVIGLMRTADWIVVPSVWWENAPLVIEEARRAGRPVICAGIGGMAEAVADTITGLHFPAGDAAALAETMRTATDPELWARLAASSRPADHGGFVETHMALYQSLLERVPA